MVRIRHLSFVFLVVYSLLYALEFLLLPALLLYLAISKQLHPLLLVCVFLLWSKEITIIHVTGLGFVDVITIH